MIPMTNHNTSVNIFDITYPCYVSPIPIDSKRILYIPNESNYSDLSSVRYKVLEGYKTSDKIYLFDCIKLDNWELKSYPVPYYIRLKDTRNIVNSQIVNYRKVLDLETDLIKNPNEFQNYINELLAEGIKSVRIMNVDSEYVFGECQYNEYMELEIE